PFRLFHGQPVPVRLQPPLQHEFWLAFLFRDHADNLFVEAARHRVGFNLREEAVLVFSIGKFSNCAGCSWHKISSINHSIPSFPSLLSKVSKQSFLSTGFRAIRILSGEQYD